MQEYNETDKRLHWLCQVLAKVNRTLVPSQEDDGHTNLTFDLSQRRILGRWISYGEEKLITALNLENLDFEILDEDARLLSVISSIDKLRPSVEDELADDFIELGLQLGGLQKPLHFQIPTYHFDKEPIDYMSWDDLRYWMHVRHLAIKGCEMANDELKCTSEIRIWPHHFDTGIYCPGDKCSYGFGFAMADDLSESPYFYLSAYPEKGSLDYSNATPLEVGKWLTTENWSGAMLAMDVIDDLSDDEQKMNIKSFIQSSLRWYKDQ